MSNLKDLLAAPAVRPRVIDDCVKLIDQEVDSKSGLTGFAVKGAYAIVKAVKPGIVPDLVDHLLEEFAERLQPFFADWQKQGGTPLDKFLRDRQAAVTEALLGVTDSRAKNAKNGTLKKAYEKLRPQAHKHVEAAVPAIARLIGKHGGQTAAA